jgi:hypothetical protein
MAGSERHFELTTFAAEINAAFEECRPPRLESGDVHHWSVAIGELLHFGDKLDAAEYGLSHVRKRFPGIEFFERMSAVFARLPPVGAQLPFDDDFTKDLQVVARPGAETVILLFCGAAHELGLPVAMEHRWHGNLNASLIYLRDFRRCSYLHGLTSLGTNREATLAEIRRIVASIGARHIVCYGTSAGVFGALSYALALNAEAVLGMSGPTNLTARFTEYSPWEKYRPKVNAEMPNVALDMRPLYACASRPPRVQMVYGQDYWDDRIQAEHMSGLSCVTLHPLEDFFEHNSIVEVIIRRQFEDLLDWLVSSPAAPFKGKVTKAPPAPWSSTLRQVGLRLSRKAVQGVRSSLLLKKAMQRVHSSYLLSKAMQRIQSSRLSRRALKRVRSSRLLRKVVLRVRSILN